MKVVMEVQRQCRQMRQTRRKPLTQRRRKIMHQNKIRRIKKNITIEKMQTEIYNSTELSEVVPFVFRNENVSREVDYKVSLLALHMFRGIVTNNKSLNFYMNVIQGGRFSDLVIRYLNSDYKCSYILLQVKYNYHDQCKITKGNLLTDFYSNFSLIRYYYSYRSIKTEQCFKDKIISKVVVYTNMNFDSNILTNDKFKFVEIMEDDDILLKSSLNGKISAMYKLYADNVKLLKRKIETYYLKKLAKKLIKCIINNKDIPYKEEPENIFYVYWNVLEHEVINVKNNRFYDNFIKGINLSENAQKFRRKIEIEIKKQSNSKCTLETINEKIVNKKSNNFTGRKSGTRNEKWPETLFTDEKIKDFLEHLVFAVNQPSIRELEILISRMINDKYGIPRHNYNLILSKLKSILKGKKYFDYTDSKKLFESLIVFFDIRPPVESFVGRQTDLEYLHEMIKRKIDHSSPISRITKITGLGGVGKSELLRKYSYEYCRFYEGNIIWIDARSRQTLTDSFCKLAETKLEIDLCTIHGNEKNIISIVDEVYMSFNRKLCLFIFDGLESLKDVREFLPLKTYSFDFVKPNVLLTTRNGDLCTDIEMYRLGLITKEDAMELIQKELNECRKDDAEILADLLHFLPLAIHQAIAYIHHRRKTEDYYEISNYVEEFKLDSEDILNFGIPKDDGKSLLMAWDVTLNTIKEEKHGQLAFKILQIMSYISSEDIIRDYFYRYERKSDNIIKNAVYLLVCQSMISVRDYQRYININRLVQKVIRVKSKENEENILREGLQLLYSSTFDVLIHIKTIWKYACYYDELVQDFIIDSDNSKTEWTPFYYLVDDNEYEGVKSVLNCIKNNFNWQLEEFINKPCQFGDTYLHISILNNNLNLVKLLIDYGANINAQNGDTNTPLHISVHQGYENIFQYLLNNNADINIRNRYKETPLHIAVVKGHYEITNCLVERGSEINALDNNHNTPLHIAIKFGYRNIVKYLIEKGCDINILGNRNYTPLHTAVRFGYEDITKVLIEKQADINGLNEYQETPLYISVKFGYENIIKYLIEHKADIHCINKAGVTLSTITKKKRNKNILQFFESNKSVIK